MKLRETTRGLSPASIGSAAILLLLLVGIVVALTYAQVPEGHTGVEREFGAVTGKTYDAGPHFTPPWVAVQDVETREIEVSWVDEQGEGEKPDKRDAVVVKSVNGTNHRVDVTVRYHVVKGGETTFVERWEDHETFQQRKLRPDVRSAVYGEGGNIPSSEIHTGEGRLALERAATAAAEDSVRGEPIVIDAVQVRKVTIPAALEAEYNKQEAAKIAIQRKSNEVQVERQEAERKRVEAQAQADVRRIDAEAEADAERIRAQGRADAIALRGQAYDAHPIVLHSEYIEAIGQSGTIIVTDGNSTKAPPVILGER